jgi:hypothetical protein
MWPLCVFPATLINVAAIWHLLSCAMGLQVAMSSVGGLLSKLAVLRDTPQLMHRTALLVEHQVAPEGNAQVVAYEFKRILHPVLGTLIDHFVSTLAQSTSYRRSMLAVT